MGHVDCLSPLRPVLPWVPALYGRAAGPSGQLGIRRETLAVGNPAAPLVGLAEASGRVRVLIVRLSSFGSILHTVPAFFVLRRLCPGATVDWLVRRPYAGLVRQVRGLRTVWEVPGLSGWWTLRRPLKSIGYDWAIDFQGLGQSALWTWWSGAARRLGFRGQDLREPWARPFYNRFPPVDGSGDRGVHVIDRNVSLLRGLGYGAEELRNGLRALADPVVRRELFAPEPPDVEARVRASLPSGPFWVLQPGASRAWKQWSVEAYADLVRRVFARTGRPVLILWGPGEADRARAIAASAGEAWAAVAPSWGWGECAIVFREARVVVGPDTGMLHWADWVGTPVVMWVVRSGRWVTAERNGPYFTRARSRTLEVVRGSEPVEAVAEAATVFLEGLA